MAANFATIPQCHFCYTHTLATLPAFGHLGEPRRPLFGNVASLWQPCHCLEHFGGSVLAATVTPPRRRDQNQPVPPALPALGLPPTANCWLPSAHCPLPLRRAAQDRAKRPPLPPPSQGGGKGGRRRTDPEAVSKRGLAHWPCRACPRFETASQRWPELAQSVSREKMLSWFG